MGWVRGGGDMVSSKSIPLGRWPPKRRIITIADVLRKE